MEKESQEIYWRREWEVEGFPHGKVLSSEREGKANADASHRGFHSSVFMCKFKVRKQP